MGEITIYHHSLTLGNRDWTLWASGKGLIRLSFGREQELAAAWLRAYAPSHRIQEDRSVFAELGIIGRLESYFAGAAVSYDGIPLDIWGTPFQREVWNGLAAIAHGEVITYRELAARIGRPQAMRAVGTANGQNPLPVILPCHRVIGTNGTLTGYRGGLQLKQELLQLEGITHVGAAGHERFAF
ncbi:methylated-DNA--[protein]-cysteine S-methyltransferase [Paenibacillus sp. S150]|uniref:methylated-DNA--[protein]-cysteine S-methyltransferase n=1 Tax=Paenibacillus sp. S150 TaxID=2749826 RepID=UPI001C59EFE2|nr:methylated-DNA--[protein]-cysteine S-methyltransferase [Paenibacillus sp. S150]MBW4084773.1 methylated-DNA--[protein]-cysteine S-methyltransferase [Paenibacillus sp. S150]